METVASLLAAALIWPAGALSVRHPPFTFSAAAAAAAATENETIAAAAAKTIIAMCVSVKHLRWRRKDKATFEAPSSVYSSLEPPDRWISEQAGRQAGMQAKRESID